jgi:hypothetical protein
MASRVSEIGVHSPLYASRKRAAALCLHAKRPAAFDPDSGTSRLRLPRRCCRKLLPDETARRLDGSTAGYTTAEPGRNDHPGSS